MLQLSSPMFCLIIERRLSKIFTENTKEKPRRHGKREKKKTVFFPFVLKTRKQDECIRFDPLLCSTVVRSLGLGLTPRAIEIHRPYFFVASHSILPSFHIFDFGTRTCPPCPRKRPRKEVANELCIASNMYPQLKVREQEDTNMTQEEATSYPPRIMESLSVEVHSSSGDPTSNHGKMSENDPPSSDAKIYSSHPKNLPASSSYTSKGKNSQSTDEDNRTNIRASSVPRPRAVLSSPDNDDIIGNQNRLIKERHTLLKRQSLYQNIQAQGKLSHRNARVAGPLSTRKVSKESGDNRLIKERKLGPEVDALKQRSTIRRG